MSSRPKALLRQSKGKKKKEQVLEDADDYLAAAVDNEDAMGKHRGGDPVKSLRFARKALELYSQALSRYPRNFDLAYNKARLELELATHPSLVGALDVPVTNVLQQALTSHRYAISLDPDNADTLFNTAQVLTTIAEYIAKDDSTPDTQALPCLEEALELQNQCLQIQQTKFSESRSIHEAAMNQSLEDDDGGAKLDAATTSAYEEQSQDGQEQWFSIIEPVTANSLIDTILSQLGTLTTLCTVLTSSLTSSSATPPISPSWIESYSENLTSNTLPTLLSDPTNTDQLSPRIPEIHRTKAIFAASLLDLAFHTQSITPEIYLTNLNAAFSSTDIDPKDIELETHIAQARALMTFNASLAETISLSISVQQPSPSSSSSATAYPTSSTRWTTLTRTSTLLTTTSQHPALKSNNDSHTLATTHLLRGDVALLMYALSHPPYLHAQAVANKAQLLKNAEVFYRNAGKLFGGVEEDGLVARFRGVVVEIITGVEGGEGKVDRMGLVKLEGVGRNAAWRREQMGEMIDEGLLEGLDLGILGLTG